MFRQGLGVGLRLIRRRPAFTAAVVTLLALGIGAIAAVFSLVEAVVLRPLPYPSPERLVMILEQEQGLDGPRILSVKPAWFLHWRDQARSFQSMAAAVVPWEYVVTGGDEPERIVGAQVTSDLFQVLGTEAALGRTLLPEDDRPDAAPVAVLSDRLWRRRHGASPEILAQTVVLDGRTHTVVGVMPPDFDLLTSWNAGQKVEVWTPLPLSVMAAEEPTVHSVVVLGRLAESVSLSEAQAELGAITAALAAAHPEDRTDHQAWLRLYHDAVVGRFGRQVVSLLGAAAFVLLIVCANAGGLLLASTSSRTRELAIRSSLGASRGRLIAQLVAETAPLGLLGGALGVALAGWGLPLIRAAVPSDFSRSQEMTIDASVLTFSASVTLIVAVLLGLTPALTISHARLAGWLHAGRCTAAGPGRSRRLLIVFQLSLTLALAHGAALMLTSYAKLQRTDQGYDPEVLIAQVFSTGPTFRDLELASTYLRQAQERLRSLPGVESAGFTNVPPLQGFPTERVVIEGRENDWEGVEGPRVWRSQVTPDYFRAMGISLVMGRLLSENDLSSELPVAVINRAMARIVSPDGEPIGKRFSLDPGSGWISVVGVVEDTRQLSPESPAMPEAYYPLSPIPAYWSDWKPEISSLFLALRTRMSPQSLIPAIREEMQAVDPSQTVIDFRTMGQIMRFEGARRRFSTFLITLCAVLGLVLIAAGIYGLMSSFVIQRTHEIGVRMALGADRRGVVGMVLGRAASLIALGIVGGLVAVLASTRMIRSLLYDLSSTDPRVLTGGVFFVVVIGLLASYLPALRATRIDPATALRSE